MPSLKQIREKIKTGLPEGMRPFLRLSYHLFRRPKRLRQHLNRFRCERNLLHHQRVDFIPPVFAASIVDDCNLRCPTCYYVLRDQDKFTPNYISPERFRLLLDKYNKKRRAEVIFLTGGEPLLHPQLDEIIDISKGYNITVKLTTNGLLVEEKLSSLKKLDYINVSIDGYDYQSFRDYRGGSPNQFNQILEGLKALKDEGVNFSMSFMLTSQTLLKVDKMLQFASGIRPSFVSFHNINPHGNPRFKSLSIQDKNTQLFLERVLARNDYQFDIHLPVIFDLSSEGFYKDKCFQPWYFLCFNAKGDISYCCHLNHNETIGNTFSNYDLNSPKMLGFRKSIIEGKIPESCLFCQRRFMDKEFAKFDSRTKKWFMKTRKMKGQGLK